MTSSRPADVPSPLDVLMDLGWYRWLPDAGMVAQQIVGRYPDVRRVEVLAAQRVLFAHRSGIDHDPAASPEEVVDTLAPAPAWEPPPRGDGEEPGEYEGSVADHERQVAEYDVLTGRMGLEPVRSGEQVLDLMIMLGLLQAEERDGVQHLRLADDPPRPCDVLPFTEDQRATEEHVQWLEEYGDHATFVLQLFLGEDDELARTVLQTTLDRLATTIDEDVEDVRQGVLVLLDEGDFTAARQGEPVDVAALRTHQRFDLIVDPERFAEDRIAIRPGRTASP